MRNIPSPEETYETMELLRHTLEVMFKLRRIELAHYGITPEQSIIMFAIESIGEDVRPAQIARFAFRKSASVTDILNRMEGQKLVTRTRSAYRKNWKKVALTRKGNRIYKQVLERRPICQILSCLSREERSKLRSYLRTLLEELFKEYEPEGQNARLSPGLYDKGILSRKGTDY